MTKWFLPTIICVTLLVQSELQWPNSPRRHYNVRRPADAGEIGVYQGKITSKIHPSLSLPHWSITWTGSAINCFVCSELFHDYCGEEYGGPTGPEALKRCGPSFPPLLACLTFRTPGGMITRGCGIRGYCDNAVEGTYCDVCFKDGCNGSFKI